jgi:secreted trypsin-like serine protease
VEKCEAYEKLTFKSLLFTSDPNIKKLDCTYTSSLIIGGMQTSAEELPHVAAIGYRDADLDQIRFACSGSLISERFVLTAAHCSRKRKPPVVVRLGCGQGDETKLQEFGVKRFRKHKEYSKKSKYHDIGLIEMNGDAKFSKFVRPACLWQNFQIPSETATAIRWDIGSASGELQEVSMNLVQNDQCNPYFAHIANNTKKLKRGIVNGQICAAGIEGGKKGTCQSESGGPLQITKEENPCLVYLVGVASFSSVGCGGENSPGVYTRVSEYLDWIEAIVWP